MKSIASVVIILSLACISGCKTSSSSVGRAQYALTPAQIVEQINANSRLIPTLWARINLYAEARDPDTRKNHTVYANGGTLQYRAPGELRIRATKDIAGLLLDLGINAQRYWVVAPSPGPDKMWWGDTQSEAEASEILLRPHDMLEGLAIRPIDLTGPDAPTLRESDADDSYVVRWHRRTGNREMVLREVFYDRETLLPKRVRLFGADGSLVLHAKLSSYASVDSPSKPAPRVARLYEFEFPQNRSRADLRLIDMTISFKGAPNDGSFRFPEKPPVARVKRVDAGEGKD